MKADSKSLDFLEVLSRIKELRISNEITKSLFPEALIGDMWVEAVDNLLECLDVDMSCRKLIWDITEP